MSESSELIRPTMPVVSSEDVDQEVALLQLQGHPKVSRSIVYRRLQGQSREYLVGLLRGEDDEALSSNYRQVEPPPDPLPPTEVLHKLFRWTFQQPEELQQAVFDFLDGHLTFEEVVAKLRELGFSFPSLAPTTQPKAASLAEVLLRSAPLSHEDALQIARNLHPSKRPEAAARQALRRLVRNGSLTKLQSEGTTYYERH